MPGAVICFKNMPYRLFSLIVIGGVLSAFSAEATDQNRSKSYHPYTFAFVEEYKFANDQRNMIINQQLRKVAKDIAFMAGVPYATRDVKGFFQIQEYISRTPSTVGFVMHTIGTPKDLNIIDTLYHMNVYLLTAPDRAPPLTLKEAQSLKRVGMSANVNIDKMKQHYGINFVEVSEWAGSSALILNKIDAFVGNPRLMSYRWHSLKYDGLPNRGALIRSVPIVFATHPDKNHRDYEKVTNAFETILASGKYSYLTEFFDTPIQKAE